ncbi:MAG: hypothetical protein RL885_07295 [Planctomycetota bacterium]
MPMLFASLLLSLSSTATADDEVLKVYDLRALTQPTEEATDRALMPIHLPIEFPGSGFEEKDSESGVSIDLGYTWQPLELTRLDRLLRHPSIGLPSSDDQRSWARFEGARLIAKAPPEIHERIAKFLAVLERELLRDVTIEIWRVDPSAEEAIPAKPTAEDFARFETEGIAKRIGESVVRTGRPAKVRAVSRQSFVQDYDAEVSENSDTGDPQVGVADLGLQATLIVNRTHEDRWLVRAGVRENALAEAIRSVDLVREELGGLQLPAVRTQIVLASGEVENGGGLLVGSSQGARYLIRPRGSQPGMASDDESWSFLPLATITESMRPEWLEVPGIEVSRSAFGFGEQKPFPPNDSGMFEVFDMLCRNEAGLSPRFIADYALLSPGAETTQRARSILESLVPEGSTNIEIELAYGTPDDALLRRHDLGEIGDEELAEALSRHCRIPTRRSDQFRWVDGVERSYIKDGDPAIAKGSGIIDPVVDTFLEGLAFEGRLQERQDSRWSLESRLHYCEPGAQIARYSKMALGGSDFELVRAASTSARPTVALESGEWTVIHRALLPIEETRTERPWICLIRVSEH